MHRSSELRYYKSTSRYLHPLLGLENKTPNVIKRLKMYVFLFLLVQVAKASKNFRSLSGIEKARGLSCELSVLMYDTK